MTFKLERPSASPKLTSAATKPNTPLFPLYLLLYLPHTELCSGGTFPVESTCRCFPLPLQSTVGWNNLWMRAIIYLKTPKPLTFLEEKGGLGGGNDDVNFCQPAPTQSPHSRPISSKATVTSCHCLQGGDDGDDDGEMRVQWTRPILLIENPVDNSLIDFNFHKMVSSGQNLGAPYTMNQTIAPEAQPIKLCSCCERFPLQYSTQSCISHWFFVGILEEERGWQTNIWQEALERRCKIGRRAHC